MLDDLVVLGTSSPFLSILPIPPFTLSPFAFSEEVDEINVPPPFFALALRFTVGGFHFAVRCVMTKDR